MQHNSIEISLTTNKEKQLLKHYRVYVKLYQNLEANDYRSAKFGTNYSRYLLEFAIIYGQNLLRHRR